MSLIDGSRSGAAADLHASGPAGRPAGDPPKVLVAQLGARRHYAVPAALHSAGALHGLYTDLYLGPGRASGLLRSLSSGLGIPALKRLAGRTSEGIPAARIRAFPLFGAEYKVRATIARRRQRLTKTWIWAGRAFNRRCLQAGLGAAEVVYAYSSAALEVFEAAKARGIKCVLDHATAPRHLEMALVQREIDRYPGWGAPEAHDPWLDEYVERQRAEAILADQILCGSAFVRTLVEEAWGLGHKCSIVPLGLRVPAEPAVREPRTEGPLRVLFVGDEPIRKGLPELAAAAEMVPPETCHFRAVGDLDLAEPGRRQAARRIDLRPRAARAEMNGHYDWADVLVLPSVSDTFAIVVLEALARGVPAIVSTNTGAADAIVAGMNGFVTPPFEPAPIAEALGVLAADRSLLNSMSQASQESVRAFDIQTYADRLVQALGHKVETAPSV
ncbi:glycosyltransferase family 4 protein [Planctomyces sp. SH-PL14]|uniref:glycosyltransferase family 4 protein n=1 Tax=Planctomyces sp. SH-PL14 TaxID=1632864 RepID=UPI00078B57D2|nr:glycosyltransferase family 4 protein [Planctomyces sp. SH-PL14]AMV16754.1 Glycogen synthase [Planctomyces sp. SH-PL14]